MYTKTFQVVQYLADTLDSYVTSGQLGAHLGVSSRMILRYVKEAEALGRENGFEIRSYKGRGYQIKITDQVRCQAFFKDMGGHTGSQGDELIREVVRRILICDGCKMDELEELFNYSRSSMSRITTLSNSYLENFGLELFSKAYTGLYISGNEISIRDCMYICWKRQRKRKSGTPSISGRCRRGISASGWRDASKNTGFVQRKKKSSSFSNTWPLRSRESLSERRYTSAIWLIWTEKSRSKRR